MSDQLVGPCVLQVQKVRNVSAPKDHEESQGAPRMLRLQMTDGHTTCAGLEFKHLSKIRYIQPDGKNKSLKKKKKRKEKSVVVLQINKGDL